MKPRANIFTLIAPMNKTMWSIVLAKTMAFLLIGCSAMSPNITPTSDWRIVPTYIHYLPPSDASEYVHYTPSEAFNFHLEFDYPGYWWLQENINEVGILSLFLGDPRFLSLPTPAPTNFHPTRHDFGSVQIWIMPSKPGQSPDSELESHKQSYGNTHWMKVLNDHKINLDGYGANVLEYQINDAESYTSLMFARRIYFMVEMQLYEIIFTVAEKDRGGEFEKGYEYFFRSLRILP